MPWTVEDYPDSMKNLENTMKKKAIDIANALTEEGYKDKQAIPIAIEQAKQWYSNSNEDEWNDYKKHGKINEHDHKYPSNPALLDKNEMVFTHEKGWAAKSRGAKKASKHFDRKEDAIDYAKKVAQNKQTKLEIYKKDDTLQETYDYTDK